MFFVVLIVLVLKHIVGHCWKGCVKAEIFSSSRLAVLSADILIDHLR